MQKILWFGISTAIIAAMIFFADLNKVIAALQEANLKYMSLAFVLGLSIFGFWSYTWHNFFKQMNMDVEILKTFKMFMAGHFFNSVTPLGQFGGEPFMAYLISKNTDYSAEKGFSAVLSADLVNTIPILTFIIGGTAFQLIFRESIKQVIVHVIYIAILTTLIGGTFIYLLWFKSGSIEKVLIKILRKFASSIGYGASIVQKLEESLLKAQKSFARIGNNPKSLLKAIVAAHVGFISQVFCLAAILLALDFSVTLTPLYFTIALAGLATFSPTPGGSGTFEAAMAGLLTLFVGIEFHIALVAAILFRATTFWPGIIIGYISFIFLNKEVDP